jgi:type I site-specific restriction-modification system R (restriction) subunit
MKKITSFIICLFLLTGATFDRPTEKKQDGCCVAYKDLSKAYNKMLDAVNNKGQAENQLIKALNYLTNGKRDSMTIAYNEWQKLSDHADSLAAASLKMSDESDKVAMGEISGKN